MKDMTGNVALVTGAGTGLGRAVALSFAARGARVVVAEINEDWGLAVTEELRSGGADALFVRTDIAVEEDMRAVVEKAVAAYGQLDFAVNNAAIEARCYR